MSMTVLCMERAEMNLLYVHTYIKMNKIIESRLWSEIDFINPWPITISSLGLGLKLVSD